MTVSRGMIVMKLAESIAAIIIALTTTTMMRGHCGQTY